MSIEIFNWDDINPEQQEGIAKYISDYTNGLLDEVPQMLPMTPEEVFTKYLAFVALEGETELAGFVGSSSPEQHLGNNMSEVGTLIIKQPYRKQGIAHRLVNTITSAVDQQGSIPYAFCNPKSKPVFLDIGYSEVSHLEIPVDAFSLCTGCPEKLANPLIGCCDATLTYNGGNNG